MILALIAAGFIGGAVRACLEIRKHEHRYGNGIIIVSHGVVGLLAGVAFASVLSISVITNGSLLWATGLAGYVGSDIIETLYKLRAKRGGGLV